MTLMPGALKELGLDIIGDMNDMDDLDDMDHRGCPGNWPGCCLEVPGWPGGQGALTGR